MSIWARSGSQGSERVQPVDEWIKLRGHAGQQRIDQVVAAIRTGEKHSELMSETFDAGSNTDTIESISAALERICEKLSMSPSLTDEIAEESVRLVSIIHSLRRLAKSNAPRS